MGWYYGVVALMRVWIYAHAVIGVDVQNLF